MAEASKALSKGSVHHSPSFKAGHVIYTRVKAASLILGAALKSPRTAHRITMDNTTHSVRIEKLKS